MKTKKILFFYPDNPLIQNQGNNARAFELLHYFKSRNFKVDFVGEVQNNFVAKDLSDIEKSGLIDKGYILRKRKHSGLQYLFAHSIYGRLKNGTKNFNRIGVGQMKEFNRILKANKYDYILISYALFAPFIFDKRLTKGAVTIVDTHDFLTAQYSANKPKTIGNNLNTEIKYLKRFDAIWTISGEEQFVFSQFLPNKTVLTIPHGIENKSQTKKSKPSIDIFYVGSNNPHNITSAQWFFDKVYPLLDSEINITVVGRVGAFIPDFENVNKIPFVAFLDDYYQRTKITICPMLSGTGLKIKVVESLSYAIPVVCNLRGVDGLSNKVNNGCLVSNDPVKFSEYIEHLLNDNVFYNTHSRHAHEFFNSSLEKNIVRDKLDKFFKISDL